MARIYIHAFPTCKKKIEIFGAVEIQNLCCYSNSSTWVALRIFDPSLAFFTKRATEEM
jgi:hypothetical protein